MVLSLRFYLLYFSLFCILSNLRTNSAISSKFFKKKLKLPEQSNGKTNHIYFSFNSLLYNPNFFLKTNQMKYIINFFNSIFYLKTNCLFIDFNFNFNYLPITNNIIFNRNNKYLLKFIKYFNVSTLIFFDINKKLFIFNKLSNYRLINVSTNNDLKNTKVDFCIDLPNTKVHNYLLYCLVSSIYLKNRL